MSALTVQSGALVRAGMIETSLLEAGDLADGAPGIPVIVPGSDPAPPVEEAEITGQPAENSGDVDVASGGGGGGGMPVWIIDTGDECPAAGAMPEIGTLLCDEQASTAAM